MERSSMIICFLLIQFTYGHTNEEKVKEAKRNDHGPLRLEQYILKEKTENTLSD